LTIFSSFDDSTDPRSRDMQSLEARSDSFRLRPLPLPDSHTFREAADARLKPIVLDCLRRVGCSFSDLSAHLAELSLERWQLPRDVVDVLLSDRSAKIRQSAALRLAKLDGNSLSPIGVSILNEILESNNSRNKIQAIEILSDQLSN